MAQVKGTAVQSSLRYVQERFGEGELARVIDALPEADRQALGHGVLASSWYAMDAFLHFMQRTLELSGAKNLRSGHSACVHRGDAVCRFEGTWD